MSDEITKAIALIGKPPEPPPEPPDAKTLLARKRELEQRRDEAVRIANAKQALIDAGAKYSAHIDDLEHYQEVAVRYARKLEALELELAKVDAGDARDAPAELLPLEPTAADLNDIVNYKPAFPPIEVEALPEAPVVGARTRPREPAPVLPVACEKCGTELNPFRLRPYLCRKCRISDERS